VVRQFAISDEIADFRSECGDAAAFRGNDSEIGP
jgi:hypothetical protein